MDIPEVSLGAILAADKEGVLRSEHSPIQTIGREPRNVESTAILYADKITDSMKKAIDETERRRDKQKAYNAEHGITPKSIQKEVRDIIDGVYRGEQPDKIEIAENVGAMTEKELSVQIKKLEKEMFDYAKNLDFEKAAVVRDRLAELKARVLGAGAHDMN